MDDQYFKTAFVNEEILVLQMGGTIDIDFPQNPDHGSDMEIREIAVKRILSKMRPMRSVLVTFKSLVKKSGSDITEEDRSALVETILKSSNHRFLVTHDTQAITETATVVARALINAAVEDKAVVFTGSTTPERYRNSDADVNVGAAMGFLQSGRTGVWVCLGGLVLPWDRAHKEKDGHFGPKRKSEPVLV